MLDKEGSLALDMSLLGMESSTLRCFELNIRQFNSSYKSKHWMHGIEY